MLGRIKNVGIQVSLRLVVCIFSLFLLFACGGGGGGGTAPANSSSSVAVGLKASAGADLTVNVGDKVNLNPGVSVVGANGFKLEQSGLEISGASTVATDIVKIVWSQIDGPAIGLTTADTTSGKAFFIAPETGVASSLTITYSLKISNAAGDTAEDRLVITVKRVNKLPVVNAGSDIDVYADEMVGLTANASDEDGAIASYSWRQISGQSVTLNNATSASVSFSAPSVSVTGVLIFEVTVKDSDGASVSDQVSVAVSPSGSPELNVYFPSAFGVYKNNAIAAFGTVKTHNAALVSVIVDGGAGEKSANIGTDGSWRVSDVALAKSVSMELQITALDSLGRSTTQTRRLSKVASEVGTGGGWSDALGLGLDVARNKLFVLTSGIYLADIGLVSVDLDTGNRSAPISKWDNSAQGVDDSAITSMAYDSLTQTAYVTTAPVADDAKLIKIDTTNGTRSLVSSNARGAGSAFQYPAACAVSAAGKIYVADVNASTLIEVEASSGNRIVRADENVTPLPVDAPLTLAVGDMDYLYWIPNLSGSNVLVETQVSVTNGSYIISNGYDSTQGSAFMDAATGLVISATNNEAYLIDGNKKLFAVDLLSGKRVQLASFVGQSYLALDDTKGLLYVVDSFWGEVYVVDPISGNKVTISMK